MNLEVLFEDNHCLAVNKPAGLAVAGGHRRASRAWSTWPTLISRRDTRSRGTSTWGCCTGSTGRRRAWCCWPRPSKAAGRLSAQFRAGTISKLYWAIVEGVPAERRGMGRRARQGQRGKTGRGSWRRGSDREQGSPGRVPGAEAMDALCQARAAAGNRAKPPASRSARSAGPTDRRDRKYGARTPVERPGRPAAGSRFTPGS